MPLGFLRGASFSSHCGPITASHSWQVEVCHDVCLYSDAVGYQNYETKDTFDAGYADSLTEVGINFLQVGGGSAWTCGTSVFDREAQAGDQVVQYNPVTMDYDNYQFISAEKGWNHTYVNTDISWDVLQETGIKSFDLYTGDSIFFVGGDWQPLAMNVAGQVADLEAEQTWTMPEGQWCWPIQNPFPVDTTFADIEKFAVEGDYVYVVNTAAWDVDMYQYLGEGKGWSVTAYVDWVQDSWVETDTSKVLIPAGCTGYYVNWNMDGRTWTVDPLVK